MKVIERTKQWSVCQVAVTKYWERMYPGFGSGLNSFLRGPLRTLYFIIELVLPIWDLGIHHTKHFLKIQHRQDSSCLIQNIHAGDICASLSLPSFVAMKGNRHFYSAQLTYFRYQLQGKMNHALNVPISPWCQSKTRQPVCLLRWIPRGWGWWICAMIWLNVVPSLTSSCGEPCVAEPQWILRAELENRNCPQIPRVLTIPWSANESGWLPWRNKSP